MKTLLTAIALLGALTLPVLAEDGYITPVDLVAGHPELIYSDLLRQVIPDLADDGTSGHLPDGIRHIDGGDAGEAPETVNIAYLNVEHIEVDGKPTLWLLTDLGDGGMLGTYSLLSVFTDEAQPRLIDAVEVDTDRFTNFAGTPLRISKTDQAMLVDSNHFNSEQSYSGQQLLFVHDGKLMAGPTFLVFGVHSCHMSQAETLTLKSKAGGTGLWPITATILRTQAQNADDAEECLEDGASEVVPKRFSATYLWDAAKGQYVTNSGELDELASQDQALF